MKTVAALHWGPKPPVENRPTIVHASARVRRDLRELFIGAYGMFAARCRAIDEPGLAIIGVDEATGRPDGVLTLLARPGRHVAGIVGRHDKCDLFLHENPDLALRHLAFVLEPVQNWVRGSTQIRYRALDLRTARGFTDEVGRPLRGLCCEGAAFVRCGGFAMFALPLGDPADWPESAADAWAMVPERVYFDEMERTPRMSAPVVAPVRQTPFATGTGIAGLHRSRTSVVMRTLGPRAATGALAAVGDSAGTLELVGRTHGGTLTLTNDAISDGVLIGRYARCDGAALLDAPSLSRVHGLLLHTGDALLFIDTASRYGTRAPGGPDGRLFVLETGTELELGSGGTLVRWRWSA